MADTGHHTRSRQLSRPLSLWGQSGPQPSLSAVGTEEWIEAVQDQDGVLGPRVDGPHVCESDKGSLVARHEGRLREEGLTVQFGRPLDRTP